MCIEILVVRGASKTTCETVGELASALNVRPIDVSSVEDKKSCLCNARLDELGARRATEAEGAPWPEYIIVLEGNDAD